ncbi:hypothetical protein C0991_003089 [Blastosporella zonata]|nr:hypothetical protein C0991_003089 [Blastosporella zonata]
MFFINTFHCATVENYINPDALGVGLWVTSVTPICIAITGFIAHIFLAHRFYVLKKNKIAYGVLAVVSVAVFALALATGILGLKLDLTLLQMILHDSSPAYQALVRSWLVIQTILEAALAGAVGYSLMNCKPPFIPAPDNSTLTRVIRGIVQSGLLVFVFSFADLIGSTAGRTSSVFALFSIPIAPLYSMLIFDTLLARRVSLASPDTTSSDPAIFWVPAVPKNTTGSGANTINLRSIQVGTKTEVVTDRIQDGKRPLDLGDTESHHNDGDRKFFAVV